ncbi:MAG: hypothetical protein ACOCRX_01310 [Candidatus Woesearchaeota archaeon]
MISVNDNILDNITFEEVITTIQSNEKTINEDTIKRVFNEILEQKMQDAKHILEKNIGLIREHI